MTHLKDRQEYIDRYDRITVESCRWHENFHLGYADKQKVKNKEERKAIHAISQYAWDIEKIFLTLRWYDDKENTIQKWMDEDARKDERLATAKPPENIFCNECYSRMHSEEKHIWDVEDKDRVMFFFECPNGCEKRRAIYDTGEEYIPKPHLCKKCGHETKRTHERVSKDEVRTTYVCIDCKHEEVDVMDLSVKEEEPDPKYEYDRARFCLAGEELRKAQEAKSNMDQLKEFVDKMKEKEEKKDVYDEIKKLEKLTVPQLKERVTEALSKKYSNVVFEKPDLGRIVSIEFSVEEMSTDNERESVHKLKKSLQALLQDTNWRLMTDGISYRLGLLTGRLRVYETEEDLVKLMEQKSAKAKKGKK